MFKLKGVVPPMITPFTENGDVDWAGLEQLTAYLRDRVDGLFINGSYGSGALMTSEERKKTADTILRVVDAKIPVMVQVGTTSNRATAELVKHAVAAGAQAVSAVAPYYYKHHDESVLFFFEEMLKAAGPNYPVYVYNNPQFQGYPMSVPLLLKLKSMGLQGMKDATFDIILHANYQRLLKDDRFDVVLGTEAMWLSARALGCDAFIPGLGNAFPELIGQLYREGMDSNLDACRQTQFKVNKLREIMYLAKSTQLAIYAMLELKGILTCCPRGPFLPASEKEKSAIAEELRKLAML